MKVYRYIDVFGGKKIKNLIYIAVVGGRTVNNYDFVRNFFLDTVKAEGINLRNAVIVSGGARGVDSLARRLAKGTLDTVSKGKRMGKKVFVKVYEEVDS